MQHLFNSHHAHRILSYLEEDSQLSLREKEVRSAIIQYMRHGDISHPTPTKYRNSCEFSTSEDAINTNRERKHKVFLGSVPKAEAERLVTIATKLYVTTEMLLNRKCYHSKQMNESERPTPIKVMEENSIDREINMQNFNSQESIKGNLGNGEILERSLNKEPVEGKAVRTTFEETDIVEEIHVPDIRSEEFCHSGQEDEETNISHVAECHKTEHELPTCKTFKDAFCQTENFRSFGEGDNGEHIGESDKESGVHLLSYSSNQHTNFGSERKFLLSSSESSSMSEDSNYCDDTCSDEDFGESSEIYSFEQADKGNKLEITGKPSLIEQRDDFKNLVRMNVCNDEVSSKDDIPDLSDSEGDTSEICSTCYTDTCSCNSCPECQESVFVLTKPSDYSSEHSEENSTHDCSCPSDECICNEKGILYEEQNNIGRTDDINHNADLNNNTVVTASEENEEVNTEFCDEPTQSEDTVANPKESIHEGTNQHPKITHQLTTESVDSQGMDEEMQILSIHEAAKNGDLQVVELLSKANRKYIETVDERGWTPIHLAAANGHTEIVKFLALEGAHISALDPSGYTALHIASMKGHKECVETLLEAEADVESVTSDGFTPLHLAALNNHVRCCKVLLAWGASIKKEDALGRTVVDMAEEYSIKRVKRLLQNFNKQLEGFNTIVDTMDAFAGKKHPRPEKAFPINVLQLLTSVMTDEHSSD